MKDVGLVAALGCGNVQCLVNFVLIPVFNTVNCKLDRLQRILRIHDIFVRQSGLEIIAVTEFELNFINFLVSTFLNVYFALLTDTSQR